MNKRPYRRLLITAKADLEAAKEQRDKTAGEYYSNGYEVDCAYHNAYLYGNLVDSLESLLKWDGKL